MKAYQRTWLAAKRQRFVNMAGGKCVECGSTESLEFDHIDNNSKTAAVNKIMSGKISRIIEEVLKCQLLCKECHHNKTMGEEYLRPKHGTLVMYRDHACGCQVCLDGHERRARIKGRKRFPGSYIPE